MDDVPPDKLRRYFQKLDGQYRVSELIRESCVFARQNLTKDPPFSKLDLISCRNVLIYLGTVLQQKVLSIFHYALNPGGYLLLGTAETVGRFGDFFTMVDRKNKVFRKRAVAPRLPVQITSSKRSGAARGTHHPPAEIAPAGHLFREVDRILLSNYAPPGVLVNEELKILQFRGRTAPYLEPAPGSAVFDLLKMAKQGLLGELRKAVDQARKTGLRVRRTNARVDGNGEPRRVAVEVVPFAGPGKERFFLVLFTELPAEELPRQKRGRKPSSRRRSRFGADGRWSGSGESWRPPAIISSPSSKSRRAPTRSCAGPMKRSSPATKRLQSTNEELETAKEELQSSNEELMTLNEELETRNAELNLVTNDLLNLLSSVDIPIVMLDGALRIRRFNNGAQRSLNLIPTDVGRPIQHMKLGLEVDDLEQMIRSVIDTLETREIDVRDRSGRWYSIRIRPYKTMDNRIEGAVLAVVDIDVVKRAEAVHDQQR